MRIPDTLVSLAEQGILDEVVRPLMSGKEAEVFLVRSGGVLRVAKVYKEAHNRTFKNRAEYTEGRKTRNSRDQRAMDKRSRHGKRQDEAAWRSTEVDMIYRLQAAGVRVPAPHHFIDGVFIMELVTDQRGLPAPRLAEVSLTPEEALAIFDRLLGEAVRMLAAGVVHGDLSDFNVLLGADGPVVIDFPQAVDASSNRNARRLLLRDVDNLQRFLSRFVPGRPPRPYAQEMWDLYEKTLLTPETRLTGRFRAADRRVDLTSVLELVGDAAYDERKRREARGLDLRGTEVIAARRPGGPRPPQPSGRGGAPSGVPQPGGMPRPQPQAQPARHPHHPQGSGRPQPQPGGHPQPAAPQPHPHVGRPQPHPQVERPQPAPPREPAERRPTAQQSQQERAQVAPGTGDAPTKRRRRRRRRSTSGGGGAT